jgi:hypothetical protein
MRALTLKSIITPGSCNVAAPDPDGWQLVTRKRKRKPKVQKARSHSRAGKVPTDLIGLCFNCFRDDHVSRNCPYPSSCLRCREPGHHAQDCSRLRLLVGDRPHRGLQARSPSSASPATTPWPVATSTPWSSTITELTLPPTMVVFVFF